MSTQPTDDTDPLPEDRWLDAVEAGRYLSYSAWSIRDFAKRKLITHSKAPGHSGGYRFKRQWLDDFLESRTVEAKTAKTLLNYREAKELRQRSRLSIAATDPDLAKAVARAKAARGRAAER